MSSLQGTVVTLQTDVAALVAEMEAAVRQATTFIDGPYFDIPGDGIDQDCSGADSVCNASNDSDGDGYIAAPLGPDCDDDAPKRHPGAPELCNGYDDNCNFLIDEGNPGGGATCGAGGPGVACSDRARVSAAMSRAGDGAAGGDGSPMGGTNVRPCACI